VGGSYIIQIPGLTIKNSKILNFSITYLTVCVIILCYVITITRVSIIVYRHTPSTFYLHTYQNVISIWNKYFKFDGWRVGLNIKHIV